MDIYDIRLENLLAMKGEMSFSEFARQFAKYDVSDNYLRQINGGTRKMGDDLARRLEEAANKPSGWMDVRHKEDSPGMPYDRNLMDLIAKTIQGRIGKYGTDRTITQIHHDITDIYEIIVDDRSKQTKDNIIILFEAFDKRRSAGGA